MKCIMMTKSFRSNIGSCQYVRKIPQHVTMENDRYTMLCLLHPGTAVWHSSGQVSVSMDTINTNYIFGTSWSSRESASEIPYLVYSREENLIASLANLVQH